MKDVIKSFPLAFKMIFRDPVNVVLSVVPTIISLAIYLYTIVSIYRNSDRLVAFFRGYTHTSDHSGIFGHLVTALLIILFFFLMSWTFIMVVGIIAAPFNSLLSSRIEQKLLSRQIMDEDKNHAMELVRSSLLTTFKNEFKKIAFLILATGLTALLNLVPIFYPVGVFMVAILLSVQFVDYSWSRHDLLFSDCLKDVMSNALPYFLSGVVFLGLVAIPIVNAFIPAFATSFYTVLWLHRKKKL